MNLVVWFFFFFERNLFNVKVWIYLNHLRGWHLVPGCFEQEQNQLLCQGNWNCVMCHGALWRGKASCIAGLLCWPHHTVQVRVVKSNRPAFQTDGQQAQSIKTDNGALRFARMFCTSDPPSPPFFSDICSRTCLATQSWCSDRWCFGEREIWETLYLCTWWLKVRQHPQHLVFTWIYLRESLKPLTCGPVPPQVQLWIFCASVACF